jgi:hypothetical protein
VSSGENTRLFYPHADRDGAAPQPDSFSVVEPAARTTLFPARSSNEPVGFPAGSAPDQSAPRPHFAAGGTQIMSVPEPIGSAARAAAVTRHFSVEQLRSRRDGFNREQELNRELEQEFALLNRDSETPLGTVEVQQMLDLSPGAAKPSKRWLRICMLGLLLASGAMLLYRPAAEPPARTAQLPVLHAASEPTAPAPPAPAPTAATVVLKPGTTVQRAAADVVAEGRYAEALPLYRQLAKSEPETSAYAEVVQILERRIAATAKPASL